MFFFKKKHKKQFIYENNTVKQKALKAIKTNKIHEIFPEPIDKIVKKIEDNFILKKQINDYRLKKINIKTLSKNIKPFFSKKILKLIIEHINLLIYLLDFNNKDLICRHEEEIKEYDSNFANLIKLGLIHYFPNKYILSFFKESKDEKCIKEAMLAWPGPAHPVNYGKFDLDGFIQGDYAIYTNITAEKELCIQWLSILLELDLNDNSKEDIALYLAQHGYLPSAKYLTNLIRRGIKTYRETDLHKSILLLYHQSRLNEQLAIDNCKVILNNISSNGKTEIENAYILANTLEIFKELKAVKEIPYLKKLLQLYSNNSNFLKWINWCLSSLLGSSDYPLYGKLNDNDEFSNPKRSFVRHTTQNQKGFKKILLGGKLKGKVYIRETPKNVFYLWKKALDAGIPVEPIIKYVELKDKMRIYTGIINGPTVYDFLKNPENKKYESYIQKQIDTIKKKLIKKNISHNDLHPWNLCVDITNNFKVYVIDFEEAT